MIVKLAAADDVFRVTYFVLSFPTGNLVGIWGRIVSVPENFPSYLYTLKCSVAWASLHYTLTDQQWLLV